MTKTIFLLLLFNGLLINICNGQMSIGLPQVENQTNPTSIGTKQPAFSWQLTSVKRNTAQRAYQIQVSNSESSIDKAEVWNSGKIESNQSVYVIYSGAPLKSSARYYWRVHVWDNFNNSSWSPINFWEMGIDPADWKASWIESGLPSASTNGPASLYLKLVDVPKPITSARLYITAHGLYESNINGQRVGTDYLTPGWTSYKNRLQYQVYEVTRLLQKGKNAIAVTVADGWYRGHLAWEENRNIYGDKTGLLAQLEITYTDDTHQTITTDASWKTSTGPIQLAGIYNGETYDARLEKNGWMLPTFDAAGWRNVEVKDILKSNLIATENEPIRKHELLKPIQLIKTPTGETILDFGQNMVGWVKFKVTGKAGEHIVIQHAEVLDKAGNFYIDNLRAAKATVHYFLKGNIEEVYEPRFSFFGFRYIKIQGYPGTIDPTNFQAIALYSDMQPTGGFESSNPLVNQLQRNIQWGQRGNFLDVPTDCPQRDERLGWTGDAQAFSRTAAFNFDVSNFFSKWLKDLAADQQPDGRVPFVIPNVLKPDQGGSAGWADAATIIPWTMYLCYGDRRILADQYESMKAHVRFMEENSNHYLWNKGFHFGDWLFYRPFDDTDGTSAVTNKYLIAQIFFSHSIHLLIKAADVLGKKEDSEKYTALRAKVNEAFMQEYVTPNGRLVSGTQTAYVLALNFDMLPVALRKQAAENLVKNIESYNHHLTTGFLGTPYLCHVLTRFGYLDEAYRLLLQETYPSWLYPVKMGATTIWERWDGIRPDGTFQNAGMNSFNHYAYGAIGDWMYSTIAGIDLMEETPGYQKIKIQPQLGGGFTSAKAHLLTKYGKVSSSWKAEKEKLLMEVEVPCNTTALVSIKATSPNEIFESGKAITSLKEIEVFGKSENYLILKIGSGKYNFVSSLNR